MLSLIKSGQTGSELYYADATCDSCMLLHSEPVRHSIYSLRKLKCEFVKHSSREAGSSLRVFFIYCTLQSFGQVWQTLLSKYFLKAFSKRFFVEKMLNEKKRNLHLVNIWCCLQSSVNSSGFNCSASFLKERDREELPRGLLVCHYTACTCRGMYLCLCVDFLLQSDFGVSLTHTYFYFATTAVVFLFFFHISVQRFLQNYPYCWMMGAADDEILFFLCLKKFFLNCWLICS